MSGDTLADHFWAWSTRVYRNHKVRTSLLYLQDRHQYNVNAVLWCLWTAEEGWAFAPEQVAEVIDRVAEFHRAAIEPIRAVRRYLSSSKPGFQRADQSALRNKLLAAELDAEKMVQIRLAQLTEEMIRSAGIARATSMRAAARQHFRACPQTLEKPVLLADDLGPDGPATLYDMILDQVAAENDE